LGHPCSRVINDAGISVQGLVMTASPPKEAARRSMRIVEKEINCAKRGKLDRNGLSYCTCTECVPRAKG